MTNLKHPKYSRRFEVDYFEIDQNLYRVVSHLKDHIHDIVATLDVSVPEMTIKEAKVELFRYPLERCNDICEQMKKIVGRNLYSDSRDTILKEFCGPKGCPNVGGLLLISTIALAPSFINESIKLGKAEQKEWEKLCGDCLAH